MASSSSSGIEIVEYQHQQKRSIASPKLYDVFISHRGPDVKDTLAKQLYEHLKARGCRAFLDREEIEGGVSIPSAIHNGICSSVVQIAIFSKGYAYSSWCLDELVDMLKQTDALFIPVFYDVGPWELRYIENDKSAYAGAFSYYQSKGRNLDKLDEWKEALVSAADISGYELCQLKDNLSEKIVSRVLQEMEKRIPLDVAKYPVGLAELVRDFESSFSETETDKVRMVGIFGIGGSGKTTLAKEFFNRKRSGYDASSFLSDVRESSNNRDLHSLQSQLFKDLVHEDRKFSNIAEGIGQLKHRLGRARDFQFLIVLDDIDQRDQLDTLLPEGMLSSSSMVIITTRDKGVLRGPDITICYRMKPMETDYAKELFCSHAFRRRDPPVEYEEFVQSFVEFCGGLPLSLKVLGAHVYGGDKNYWEIELAHVRKIQHNDIMGRLKISIEGLHLQEKQIFIDIACFFYMKSKWDLKSMAISIWKACGWSAEHAVQTLQDKCLIELWGDDQFRMHDHLRDLGRQMADDLGPRRLWKPDCLRSMEAKGFKQILAETKDRCFHSFLDSSLQTNITYFISSSNDSAEPELLLLDIESNKGYKLINFPSWIPLPKLHYLRVSEIKELWSTFQQQLQTNTQASFELRMLKILDSPQLENLSDLIGKCNHLEELQIFRSFEKTGITSFVKSLQQLSNLRVLHLLEGSFCSGENLNLSEGTNSTSSRMNNLESIHLRGFKNISKLLISAEICPSLRSMKVYRMWNLNEMALKQLERLNTLELRECPKLETISGLSSLTGLQVLHTRSCIGLRSLPTVAHLCCLERIIIVECNGLKSIQGLEELKGLKSLVIEVHGSKDASVWNCVYGLTVLLTKANLFIVKSELGDFFLCVGEGKWMFYF